MRVVPWVSLVSLCLALTGCNTFGKKGQPSPAAVATRPTVDPNLPPRGGPDVPPPVTAPPSPVPEANGILAGQVVDSYNRTPPATFIEVSSPGEPGKAGAPIEVAADGQGYFTIQGLQPGRAYQLVARAHDGERLLAGTAWVRPPNPRVLIRISEDLATKHTPPMPPAPIYPGRSPALGQPVPPAPPTPPAPPPPAWPDATQAPSPAPPPPSPAAPPPPAPIPVPASGAAPAPAANGGKPPAEIGRPIKDPEPVSPPPRPVQGSRPQDIANGPIARADVPVNVPSWTPSAPTPPAAPPPGGSGWPTTASPSPAAPSPPAAMAVAVAAAPVPFCVLTGYQLNNFALNDLNGQRWEFRNRRGRLVLLDFWGTWCRPCQEAIYHLRILQQQYGSAGLEVVGIAYEEAAPLPAQIQRVNQVSQRLKVNYRILMGGGNRCPVREQFQVHVWPTLVLLDETGKIIWRGEGVDQQKWWDLELLVRQRLGVR